MKSKLSWTEFDTALKNMVGIIRAQTGMQGKYCLCLLMLSRLSICTQESKVYKFLPVVKVNQKNEGRL